MKDGTPVHTVFEAAEMNLKLHSLQTVYIYIATMQPEVQNLPDLLQLHTLLCTA